MYVNLHTNKGLGINDLELESVQIRLVTITFI